MTGGARRLMPIVEQAWELEGDLRRDFLEGACAGDPELRAEVEELLAIDADPTADAFSDDSGPFVARLVPESNRHLSTAPEHPRRIGAFHILRQLGRGGMGTVYEAEQDKPKRLVALKVLTPGLLSPDVIRRFERESELLGRFQHPGIAQVYEAGSDTSTPGMTLRYFAMELIHGPPVTEFADTAELGPDQRLALIAKICDAVTHAHARGVIHRDLKPANVLIDDSGQPKVLDFGIARTMLAEDTAMAVHTRTGQFIGTLAYMSPEQAGDRPDDVDERSDVYALGVIAFQLLAGRLPHQIDGLSLPRAMQKLRDVDADQLASADTSLRGDVDAIIGKALTRERNRRYGTVADLANDIRRYLRREPIAARPASASYRMRRFIRRHRILVSGASAIFLVLSIALGSALFVATQNAAMTKQARRNEYRSSLAAVAASLREHDTTAASAALEQAPVELRQWEWQHLAAGIDRSHARFEALSGDPQHLVSSADSATLTVMTGAGIVRVSSSTGIRLETVQVARPDERFILLSPDGRSAVSNHVEGYQTLVNLQSGERTRFATTDSTPSAAFDPTGRLVAGIDRKRSVVCLLDAHTGEQLRSINLANVRRPVVSREGRVTLFSEQARVILWEEGKPVRMLPSPVISEVVFSQDERRIVGIHNNGILIWDAQSLTVLPSTGKSPDVDGLYLGYGPDDSRMVVEGRGRAFLIDGRTTQQIAPLRGKTSRWGRLTYTFSPDGRYLAVVGKRSEILVLDAQTGHSIDVFVGHIADVRALRFTTDGRRLASIDNDGQGRLWRVDAVHDSRVLRGHGSFVYDVTFSPDGRRIASGAWDGTVRLWDAATGDPIATLETPDKSSYYGFVAFDGTGNSIAATHTQTANVWDSRTGQLVGSWDFPILDLKVTSEKRTKSSPLGRALGVAWHPDGHFAISSHQRPLYLARHRPRNLELERWESSGVHAIRPDGALIAAGRETGVIEIWHFRQRERLRQLGGHSARISELCFSPCGKLLASASEDGTVRIWDLATGAVLHVLRRHSGFVYAIAFSPDGTRLASGGDDDLIRIWDVSSGDQVAVLRGHQDYVHALAFSPDGDMLASGSGDQTVRIWETTPLAVRLRRRDERRTRVRQLEPLIERLFAESSSAREVVEHLEALPDLSSEDRRVALDLTLGR